MIRTLQHWFLTVFESFHLKIWWKVIFISPEICVCVYIYIYTYKIYIHTHIGLAKKKPKWTFLANPINFCIWIKKFQILLKPVKGIQVTKCFSSIHRAQGSWSSRCGYFSASSEQLRDTDGNFNKCYEGGFMCKPNWLLVILVPVVFSDWVRLNYSKPAL